MGGVARPRIAVVGHVEWVTHARGAMPAAGEIGYLLDPVEEPGGGGAVAAAQAARLGADTLFLTAVGDDAVGRRTVEAMRAFGMEVRAAVRPVPHTTVLSADAGGDRAIAVVGERLHPQAGDDLGWADLADVDAVYFTGRDPATLPLCREAPLLVVMARRWTVLAGTGVAADVLVGSATDPSEQVPPGALSPPPRAEVWTEGADGGRWRRAGGGDDRWIPVAAPGPVVDSYGCGDSFAAGLTVGLGSGLSLEDAIARGARCGAWCATGRGLAAQLTT